MGSFEPIVYVVDDDAPALKAMARLLRAAGLHVMTFSCPRRFLEQHDGGAAGCLVLDMAMPELSGLDLQQTLKDAGEELPIIFVTGRANVPASVRAMKQGAADFLTKPVERDELLRAVGAALERDAVRRRVGQEVEEIRRRIATLTPREYEVFQHVIIGKLNKQTAAALGAAEKTIKVHRARVMEKMHVGSVAELVRLADRAGVNPESQELVEAH